MKRLILAALAVAALSPPAWAAEPLPPAAIYTDPAPTPGHPARMEVLHIPTVGGLKINGVEYVAAGAGLHPTLVLLHGWPGNEKNLDLAQAVRRAGWNVVTFNYRGSWGSPGTFSFGGNIDDAKAVLAFVRDPANAKTQQADTGRLVIAGHSMGGWITAMTASQDPGLQGVVLISAADMGGIGNLPPAQRVALAAGNAETLAGVTPQSMADELNQHAADYSLMKSAHGLAAHPLLVISSDDGLAPQTDALVAKVRAEGGTRVSTAHLATDHGYSDKRIALEAAVIRWLQGLK
jgi:pimeloyl-ACP methyl ester carboxylesterase